MIRRNRTVPLDDDNEEISDDAVLRYFDYISRKTEQERELDALREQCITNSRASLLSLAQAPKDSGSSADEFFRRQRALFKKERELRKEADDNNHGITEEEGIPPGIPYSEIEEKRKNRRSEALAFMDRYLSAKDSIMKRTGMFWRSSGPNDDCSEGSSTHSMPLLNAVEACSKRWEGDDRELESLMTEIEITASSSGEKPSQESNGEGTSTVPLLENKKLALPILWCSLMAMCSTNLLGLVLSIALLNYNLRLDKLKPHDVISLLSDGKFFALCRLILQRVQEEEDSRNGEDDNSLDSSKRSLASLRSAMEEVLQSDAERLMSETVSRFQQAIEPFQEPNVLRDNDMPDDIETNDTSMEDIPYIETMQTMYSADNDDNRIDEVEEGPEILVNDRKKTKSDQEDKEDEDDQAIEIVFETHDGNDEYNPISPRTSKTTFLNRVRELASESRDVTEENHVHFEGMESRDGHGQTRQDIDRDVLPVEEQSSSQAFNLYERSLSPIVEEHEPLPISSGSTESIDACPHAVSSDVFEVSEASHRGMVDNRQSPLETLDIQESMHEVGSTNDQNLETSKSVVDASSILVEANDMAAHIFSLTSGEESKKFFDEAQQKAMEIMSWFDGDQQKDEMFAATPEQQVARCLPVDGTVGAQAKDTSDQLQLENTEVAKDDSSTKAHPQTVNETCSTIEVEKTREVQSVEVTATSETTKEFLDSGAGTDPYLEVAENSSPIVAEVAEKPQVKNTAINEEIFHAEESKTAPEEEDSADATITGDTTITLPKMAEAEINLDLLVYETGATVKADQLLLEAKEVAEDCPAAQRQQVAVREDTTSATQGDGIEKKADLWVDETMSLKVIDAADELKVDTAADTPTTQEAYTVGESTAVKVVDGAEKLQLDTNDVKKTVQPVTEGIEVPDVDSETIVVGESATSTLLKTEADVDQDISVDETVVVEAANDKVPIETGDLSDDKLNGSELKVVQDENGVEAIVMDETTRLFLEAELEAERARLQVEAKVEAERLRLEAEAKKAIELARLEAEAILEAEKARLETEAEAKAAAEIEALRKAAEAKALAAEEERLRKEEIEKVRLEVERQAGLTAEEATLLKQEKEIEERARRKAEAEREQAIEEAKRSESARIRAEEEIARMRVEMEERMAEMARLEAERLSELGDDEASLARINAEAVLRRVREAESKRKCKDGASSTSSRFTSKIPSATSVASKEGSKSSVRERFVSHIPRASSTSSRSSKKGIEQSESNHSHFFSCGENPGSVCTQDYLTIYMRTSDGDEDELTLDLSDLSNQEEYDITTMESFATHWSSGTKKYIFESTPAFAKHAKALRGLGGREHGGTDNSDESKSPPESANKYVWSHGFYFIGAMTIVGIGTTIAVSPKYRAKISSFDPKIVLSLAKVSLASAQDCIQTEYIAKIAAESLNAVRNHALIEKAIKITMESIAAAKVHLKIGSC